MDETDKKIRELTEAMHAEKDIRIRNRMMAVRGILAGYPTKDAAYFADVDRRTVQLWAARFDEGGIGGLRDAPRQGQGFPCKVRADQETGRQACRQEHAHPQKASEPDMRETERQVQPVQRAQDPAPPRILVQEVCHYVCLDSRLRCGKAVAGRLRRHDIVGKKARIYDRGARRVHIHQDWDKRKEAVVARRGTRAVIRHGRRDRTVVYGALAEDGIRLMRQYERFDGPTFVRYLKEARRKWGKVLLIMDNAGQHKTKAVRKYLEEHDEVEILYRCV